MIRRLVDTYDRSCAWGLAAAARAGLRVAGGVFRLMGADRETLTQIEVARRQFTPDLFLTERDR